MLGGAEGERQERKSDIKLGRGEKILDRFFRNRGVKLEVERWRVEKGEWFKEIIDIKKGEQRKKRWKRIINLKYNK